MIFAVFDPSPLTVCINCSFFTFILVKLGKCCVDSVCTMNVQCILDVYKYELYFAHAGLGG